MTIRQPWASLIAVGSVVAIAHLNQCLQIGKSDFDVVHIDQCPEHEWMFGNFLPGRYGWFLSGVKQIVPVPAKGQLGLWEWTTTATQGDATEQNGE